MFFILYFLVKDPETGGEPSAFPKFDTQVCDI